MGGLVLFFKKKCHLAFKTSWQIRRWINRESGSSSSCSVSSSSGSIRGQKVTFNCPVSQETPFKINALQWKGQVNPGLFWGENHEKVAVLFVFMGNFHPWHVRDVQYSCMWQTDLLYPIMIYWILLGFRWSMMKLLNIFKRRRLKESNKSSKCWDLLRYSWVRLSQMV